MKTGLRRVLVVHGDAGERRALRAAIGALPQVRGHACAGGVDALLQVRRETPHLIVADAAAADMGGADLLQVLRGDFRSRSVRILVPAALAAGSLAQEIAALL